MSKTSPFTIEWHGLIFEGTAVYTPGDPGRLFGPPEKCYPPEPSEIEVVTMKNKGGSDAMFLFEGDDADEIADLVKATFEEGDEDGYDGTDQD